MNDLRSIGPLLGSLLIYLTIITKPDISFAVQYLRQFMASPTTTDYFNGVLKVDKYLKNAPGQGLIYRRVSQPIALNIYGDAD